MRRLAAAAAGIERILVGQRMAQQEDCTESLRQDDSVELVDLDGDFATLYSRGRP